MLDPGFHAILLKCQDASSAGRRVTETHVETIRKCTRCKYSTSGCIIPRIPKEGLHDEGQRTEQMRRSAVTLAMQNSRGFSFSRPYFSSASTTAKSAVSLVESRMVLYGMLGFRLSAYIRSVPPAGGHNANLWSDQSFASNARDVQNGAETVYPAEENISTNILYHFTFLIEHFYIIYRSPRLCQPGYNPRQSK